MFRELFGFANHPGQLLVDEAVSLAKTICTSSANVLCFVLLPVIYSGMEQTTVMKHKRYMEDLMVALWAQRSFLSESLCV